MMLWRQPNQIPEKGFFLPNLVQGLEQEGCFLCAAVIEHSERNLNSLFYEGNMNKEALEDLIATNGFCNGHAWRATFILSASAGLAVIYQPLLEKLNAAAVRLLKTLEESREPRLFSPLHRQSARRLVSAEKICPVCEWNHTLEKHYLSDLLDFFNDATLAPKFAKSFGLCLPHLQMAVDGFPEHANLSRLLEIERKKFAALQMELVEFDRKRSYEFVKEPKGAEQTSWRRAVELFVGKRGVFPHAGE
jgi:hypothetical protein